MMFLTCRWRNGQQLPKGQHPDEAIVLVRHIDVEHHLRVRRLLQPADRLCAVASSASAKNSVVSDVAGGPFGY
ncbi:MAG: hypothetical protein U0231_15110 [Nitrospiraceae bacterium]